MSVRIRTGYSFRHAAGKLEDVAKLLLEQKHPIAPITDTASTFGWTKWDEVTRRNGMRPAFGVELAVSREPTAQKPIVDYWTFLARDSVVPLHGLIGVATEQFRYEPLLTIDQATSAASAVNVIMGHRAPVGEIDPRPGLYFGFGPGVSGGQLRRVIRSGHPCVATSNNRFVREQDRSFYEMICGRRAASQSYPQWIMSDDEWIGVWATSCEPPFDLREPPIATSFYYDALDLRDALLEQSTARLRRADMAKPERRATLLQLCLAGAQRLKLPMPKDYNQRLERELALITEKGFEDYFYLVADLVTWARARMLVGPARGSSCGSLVCYLLGITTVDPIKHDLLFERFIDVNRADLPDIDIDFSDQHRELIFDYMREKYGADRVARLGTVNMYQARSALRELALALDIPVWAITFTADQAEKTSLGAALKGSALAKQYPDILIAAAMENHPKHAGQHAAGMVITNGPVTDVVAVDRRTGATMCDKYDAETLNLLKIDALGLTQLSIFEDALELAGLQRSALHGVPLNDPKAFHVLNTRRFAGVFQFNGPALQALATKVTISSLDDIVALTALARPGPLDSGEAQRWIKVKTAKEKPSYPHPRFEPLLRPTLGVVIYQEQVMQICREVGMSWEDVSAVRRLISKSAGPEALDKYRAAFIAGGADRLIPEQALESVWEVLRASGAYSFNKSHAVAYAIISYWCCWMKAHHALEYAAAALSHAGEETQLKLLRELAREGTPYRAADKKLSTDRWTVAVADGRKLLIGPLTNVIGIGPKHARTILSSRIRSCERLPSNVGKLLDRMKTKIDDLWPIQTAIKQRMTPQLKEALVSKPTEIIDIQPNGQAQVVTVWGLIESVTKINENDETRVKRRNGRVLFGEFRSINLWIADDTDRIFAKIDRHDFAELGQEMLAHGKGYYAIRGLVPPDFRMIKVEKFKFIGQDGADHAKDIAAQ